MTIPHLFQRRTFSDIFQLKILSRKTTDFQVFGYHPDNVFHFLLVGGQL
jgi:hypothetical protein